MTDNTNLEGPELPDQPILSKVIESAAILTLAIGCMYAIGWAFSEGYFLRIGVVQDWLNLPTDYYLRHGALPVIVVAIAVAISLSQGNRQPDSMSEAFKANLHWLIVSLGLCGLMYAAGSALRVLGILYLVASGLGFLVVTFEKRSLAHFWLSGSLYRRLCILFALFLLMFLTAAVMGNFVGKSVLEGKGYGGERRIRIEPKDEQFGEVKGKEFILVMYRDDLYYLVERKIPADDFPDVVIVPKSEIKYATTFRGK